MGCVPDDVQVSASEVVRTIQKIHAMWSFPYAEVNSFVLSAQLNIEQYN